MPTGIYIRKNKNNLKERFMKHVGEDWQWMGTKDEFGYGMFAVRRGGKRAHRVSYELFVGPIPQGMLVLHSCDDPGCVNPDHLHLGTIQTNMQERNSRGRLAHKLTREQIFEIRNKLSNGNYSQHEIAKEYNINQSTVSRIGNEKRWKHLLS